MMKTLVLLTGRSRPLSFLLRTVTAFSLEAHLDHISGSNGYLMRGSSEIVHVDNEMFSAQNKPVRRVQIKDTKLHNEHMFQNTLLQTW